MNSRSDRLRGLYAIIDPAVIGDRDEIDVAREAVAGGARLLQLRDKRRDKRLQLQLAEALHSLCSEAGALFIVNDHTDVALAAGADGVHVGQRDLPVPALRRVVSPGMIIGCSTNNPDEARQAELDGADYVSVGRLYTTGSKADTRPATLDVLRDVKAAVSVPVCAIGGINESNIDDVIAAGADMAAVIAAVVAAADVRQAARALSGRFS